MTGIVLYDGYQLPPFDAQEALQDVLDDARGSDFQEEAHKLSMCVCGGYGKTLEVTTPYWATRFSDSLKAILKANSVTLRPAPRRGRAFRRAGEFS